MRVSWKSSRLTLLCLVMATEFASGFFMSLESSSSARARASHAPRMSPRVCRPASRQDFLGGVTAALVALVLPSSMARADPPLEKFTKDQICIERNLNGSCSKFGVGNVVDEVISIAKSDTAADESENELIATLKRRTIENKARNDEEIATKTFVNGQSGEFGPFSRYVPIKHKDTGKYELVLIRELDGLKKAGLVVNERGQDVFADVGSAGAP